MWVYINQDVSKETRRIIVKTVHASNIKCNRDDSVYVDNIDFLGGPSDEPLVILPEPSKPHSIALFDRLAAILKAARQSAQKAKYTVTRRDAKGKYSPLFHVRFLGVYMNSWSTELSAWHFVDLDMKI